MEYVQLTLNDWIQMKQRLRQELLGVKQSFVRIGYVLRQIEDQKLYEQDGYKSIAEFAQAEYGLGASITSRFMSINREYSVGGYSERLREEYAELGRSQLEEMLKLPDSDRQMIQPETAREDIRGLKRFNKTEPAAGEADDLGALIERFYWENPEIYNELVGKTFEESNIGQFTEIVNPAGNRSYKKGLFFLMMYENRVTFKKIRRNTGKQDMVGILPVIRACFGADSKRNGRTRREKGRDPRENAGRTDRRTRRSERTRRRIGRAGSRARGKHSSGRKK